MFDKESGRKAGMKSSRKGVPNKATEEIRQTIEMFVNENSKTFQVWIERIAKDDPAKAFDCVTKLTEFVLPKKEKVEIEFGAGPIDMSKWK